MAVVVLAVLFILGMIGLARPFIGLLALMIVMELQPGELYPMLAPLHLERVVAGLLVFAFFIHGEKLRFPVPIRWFLAFYGAMLASIPLAFWRGNAAASCFSFLEVVVYVLLAVALLTTESRIKWFMVTFVMLMAWMSASAIWNYIHGGGYVAMGIYRADGVTSSAGDPNTMSLTLLAAMPLGLALLRRSSPFWVRCMVIVTIGLSLVTIVETGSRGGAIGVLFLLLLLMLRRPKNFMYLPVLILLAPLVWMIIPQQYKARYESVDHLKTDESYQNRVLSWEGGIGMFESNPITGVGAGNYVVANGDRFWPGNGRKIFLDAHSLYFKIIGELGLLGLITFAGFVISVFQLNFRVSRQLRQENASAFLRDLPGMFNIIFCQLLFAGYASHDLYRNTWYIVAVMACSVALLPQTSQISGEDPIFQKNKNTPPSDTWSPALLPALRNQVPARIPPA